MSNKTNQTDDLATMLGTAPKLELEHEEVSNDETELEEENPEGEGEIEEEEEGGAVEGFVEEAGGEGGEGDEEEKEEEPEGESEGEIADLKAQLETALTRIETLEQSGAKEAEEAEDTLQELSDEAYVTEEELDEVISDPEKFNAAMQKVAKHSYNKALEEVMRVVPRLVSRVAGIEVANQAAAADFYRANSDLIPHKAAVQKIYTDMVNKNPDAKPFELLKTLAPEVRTRLKLKTKQTKTKNKVDRKKKASFAPGSGPGGGRTPGPPDGIGSEVGKMLKLS